MKGTLVTVILSQCAVAFINGPGFFSKTSIHCRSYRSCAAHHFHDGRMKMADSVQFNVKPMERSSAVIDILIPGSMTKKAYQDSLLELSKKQTIPGFSTVGGNKRIPEQVLVGYFGEKLVKGTTLESLTDTAVKQAIKNAGIKAIGQAKLVSKAESIIEKLKPGEPLNLSVQVDVWPKVSFNGPYTGFTVTAQCLPFDTSQYNATINRLRERAAKSSSAPDDHAAEKGDVVRVDMYPYELLDDDTRGQPLPALAGGDDVEIVLETEKFMPGLIDGLIGIKKGEMREITVTFPKNLSGPAAVLQGKKAVFEIKCNDVLIRTLPEVNDEFASSIRQGLTMNELRDEVLNTLNADLDKKKIESRNKALENALLHRTDIEVPETLFIEQARQKFAVLMTDMKNQGDKSDEEIRAMISPENFEKYKDVVRESTTRQLKVSLALSEIAELEKIEVDPQEIDDQLQLLKAEARGEEIDEKAARDRIEATLQKEVVLQWIAERSTIEFIEAELEKAQI